MRQALMGWLSVAGLVGLLPLEAEPRLRADEAPKGSPSAKPPWQRLLQDENAKKAAALEKQSDELQEAGKFEDALKLAEQLAELRRKHQGADHWEAVSARHDVEALRRVLRQEKKAQAEYGGIFSLQREVEGLTQKARLQEAQLLLNKVLAIRQKVLGEDHIHTSASYNNLAEILYVQGKYQQAEEGFRMALTIRRKVLGEDHPDTAGSYNNVAMNLQAEGKYQEADEGLRKALAIFRKVLGEDHPNTATGYDNVASNLSAQGKYTEAEEAFRKALAIRRKVLGEDHPDTATGYNNVAMNLKAQGKYQQAEVGLRKALAIFRKVLDEDHPNTATGYNNVAGNLNDQGQYQQAEEGYRKALAISRTVLGGDHPDTARSYNNLAFNLNAQGQYQQAEEGYRKALAIWRTVLGEDHRNTATSYNNLALNLQAQGKYQQAEEGFRKALAIRHKVLGEEHPDTASSYNNLAYILNGQGQYQQAEGGYRKALAIYRKVLSEDHPDTARGYNNLAKNLNAQSKYQEAEAFWILGADTFTKVRPRIAASGLGRSTKTGEVSPLSSLAGVLARNGKFEAAWRRFEESLGRGTWDDLTARLHRPLSEQVQQAQLVAKLDRLDKLIEKIVANKDTSPEQDKRRQELLTQQRQAQDELTDFTRKLKQKYGPAAGQVFERSKIQAAVPADAALVGWLDLPPAGPSAADPNGEHWAVLLRSTGVPLWIRLRGSGPQNAWTEADTKLPGDLRTALQERRGDWQRLAQKLKHDRLEPMAKHLASGVGLPVVRQLIVLPSTALAGVPIESFADGYTVSYAQSGTLFAHLRSQPKVKAQGLFAVADPVFKARGSADKEPPLPPGGVLLTLVHSDSNAARAGLKASDVLLRYNGKDLSSPTDLAPLIGAATDDKPVPVTYWRAGRERLTEVKTGKLGVALADKPAAEAIKEQRRSDRLLASRGDGDWPELPGTRAEIGAIQRLFRDKPAPLVLTDSEASQQRLFALAQEGTLGKYRYLHLATHGEVNDSFPLRSAVILSRDALPDPGQQLLEGKPIFDGRLTAEQVLRHWNLNAELVTLSACQTALGKYERGEGHVGFAQALVLSGSRSVCLSLWKVDDAATALLMERFYQNLLGQREGLKQPLGKARALAEAKQWLRELPREQALKSAARLYAGVDRGKRPALPVVSALEAPPTGKEDRPYAHPYYWAAFVLTGDPD